MKNKTPFCIEELSELSHDLSRVSVLLSRYENETWANKELLDIFNRSLDNIYVPIILDLDNEMSKRKTKVTKQKIASAR